MCPFLQQLSHTPLKSINDIINNFTQHLFILSLLWNIYFILIKTFPILYFPSSLVNYFNHLLCVMWIILIFKQKNYFQQGLEVLTAGRLVIKSWMLAFLAASITSSIPTSVSKPYDIFSRILQSNRMGSWLTTLMNERRRFKFRSRISLPSKFWNIKQPALPLHLMLELHFTYS